MSAIVGSTGERRSAFVSVDVEQDISTYLENSYIGIEDGLPALLDVFREEGVPSDFFIQGSLLPRFEEQISEIRRHNHAIGVHGLHHCRLFLRPKIVQRRHLEKATDQVAQLIKKRPVMFRAPGFSTNNATFDILEQLDYRLDSSVMPGATLRMMKQRIQVRDFKTAPREIYHPSRNDFLVPGNRVILEVPLTENLKFPGSPLGLGYLQTYGLDRTLDALKMVQQQYCTFLIHTWEAVDLGKHYPGLPKYVHQECSRDLEPLRSILGMLRDGWHTDSLISLLDRKQRPRIE